nr:MULTISPECIES: glutamate-5-semialdehyde dehydrogenase [unclassified Dysgonomonas]
MEQIFGALISLIINNLTKQISELFQLLIRIINEILEAIADEVQAKAFYILAENQKDLDRIDDKESLRYAKLQLTEETLLRIAEDIRGVIELPSPTGKQIENTTLPNGLRLCKTAVPFGVVGVVFETGPYACFEVFSLCFKSANACVLKGDASMKYSNQAIVDIIRSVLDECGLNPNVCILLPNHKETMSELLQAKGFIDLIVPKGGRALIDVVCRDARMPVIETGAGVCHTYFHSSGKAETGQKIITNAKIRRINACNTLDCLVIDKDRLNDLPYLCRGLRDNDVIIYADRHAYAALRGSYPDSLLEEASADSYGTEFLDYKMAVKTVSNIEEALRHISQYGGKHSEAVVAESADAIALFRTLVDAACVYVNASTAFTDGQQFGLGGEVGVSVQKLHARGPVGLEGLCTHKWIVEGEGQIREN